VTTTIPVRLDRKTLEALDTLIALGIYKNRSEAIRDLLNRGLDSHGGVEALGKVVSLIDELYQAKKIDLSGLELERDRF
jgi:Arc/MetJ-type ribon-helix-helix transcriptional regulator